MQKPVLAAMILLVILSGITQIVEISQAFTFGQNYTTSVSRVDIDRQLFCNYTLTVPDGYYIRLQNYYAYTNSSVQGGYIEGIIYDKVTMRVAVRTGQRSIFGSVGWFNKTINENLMNGSYILDCLFYNASWYYSGSGYAINYTNGVTVEPYLTSFGGTASWNVNAYIVYDIVPIGYNVEASASTHEMMNFSLLLILAVICLLLAWKSSVPILNFVFGAVSLGIAAYLLGSSMMFIGWINLLTIVMATICILSGAIKLRS